MEEKWHRHLGVNGICERHGKILVIHKSGGPYTGRFDLPGGTIEPQETVIEALHREIQEEVGVEVQVKKQVGVCDYVVPYALSKRETSHIHHVALFFAVDYLGGQITAKPELFEGQDSLGASWVALAECTVENASPLVLQAVNWLLTGEMPAQSQRLDDWLVK
ncbi:NUDIX hydrolase [Paenibacillus qinlingensis]|uniref:ADP-ribose pyrophosphatase YjhB (NUDIX family) n=1 Tax=Paenibacillus qinlingensis TaxID=1837343 RepID=A0ABU1NRE7_9BACL|nr:NUDIX hydrolase [Paenibacillus qinlingensis]MDR6549934.1 ADP-ribose pyrophosphatase YjhB (NUDIX family) [Paenibacillus qinlingensis]